MLIHLHRDHWDEVASLLIAKNTTLFCQPLDEKAIREKGFTSVVPIVVPGLERDQLSRAVGQHGTGEIGKKVAPYRYLYSSIQRTESTLLATTSIDQKLKL